MGMRDDSRTIRDTPLKNCILLGGVLLLALHIGGDRSDRRGFVSMVPDFVSRPTDEPTDAADYGAGGGSPDLGSVGPQIGVFVSLLDENQRACLRIKNTCQADAEPASDGDDKSRPRRQAGNEAVDYGVAADRFLGVVEPEPDNSQDPLDECLGQVRSQVDSAWQVIDDLHRMEGRLWGKTPEPFYGAMANLREAHEDVCTEAVEPYNPDERNRLEDRFQRARKGLEKFLADAGVPLKILRDEKLRSALNDYDVENDPDADLSDEAYRRDLANYQLWLEQKESRRQVVLRRQEERRKWQQERLEEAQPRESPRVGLAYPGAGGQSTKSNSDGAGR